MQHRQQFLQHAHAEQEQVVSERNAARASVEQQLGQRKQLLGSIQGEIAHLRAAEAARQAALQAQLQQQLAAQQSAQRQAASRRRFRSAPASTSRAADPTAPPPTHGGVVGVAMQYLGTPYVWGGASPSGFDCSGFVMYVYAQIGVSLPHSSYAQYGYGSPVSMSQLQPGDLVFFDGLGHVGIYVGGGSFIHAPHTGDVVKISSLSGWYVASTLRRRATPHRAGWLPVSRTRVELLDLSREVLRDDAALELQRRRHLVLLCREVAREDAEALDLLEARELAVDLVHDRLHAALDLVRGQARPRRPGRR